MSTTEQEDIQDTFWYLAIRTTLQKIAADHVDDLEPEDFVRIKEVYERYGSDWQAMSQGSVEEWQSLRSACKAFFKVRKDLGKRPYNTEDTEDKGS